MTLEEILRAAAAKGASDIHLKAGIVPVARRMGALRPLFSDHPALTGEEIEQLAVATMNTAQVATFRKNGEIDFGLGISGLGRFRINLFKQRGTARLVARIIPFKVPEFSELALPERVAQLSQLERGLLLVTGIAGSGKSTTLAAIVDAINRRDNKHILTIEDPIEYLIRDRKSIITQREIGVDTHNFSSALRTGLRQDPDVIFIGEMRDRETIETALVAAETGHLVLSTLHTIDAVESINRILSAFEANQQNQIRLQLGSVLRAVISQRLAQKKDGTGRVPAVEILINTPRIRQLICEPQNTHEIREYIEEGHAAYGMQSFDQSLMDLLNKDLITFDEALLHCTRPEDFRIRFEGIQAMDGKKWSEAGNYDIQVNEKWKEVTEIEVLLPIDAKRSKRSGRKS